MQEKLITEPSHCSFKDLWILVLLSNICNKCVVFLFGPSARRVMILVPPVGLIEKAQFCIH